MNPNYTSICFYCGEIYKSNRSSSKYCCHKHNSLYHQNRSQIDYSIEDLDGVLINCHEALIKLHNGPKDEDGWGPSHTIWSVYPGHFYFGPVPFGEEYLFVSGFLIKKVTDDKNDHGLFFFKPFQKLTKEEKAKKTILEGNFKDLKTRNFHSNLATIFAEISGGQ